MNVTLSAIVCTRNRPGRLRDVILDLLAQTDDATEIVVIDQSDLAQRQHTARWLAAAAPSVHHVLDAHRSLPTARNRGMAESRGALVWFLDDDVRLMPGALAALRRGFEQATTGGLGGRIVERSVRPNRADTGNEIGPGGRVLTRLDGSRPQDLATLKGACMAFRREALEVAGPCDPGFGGTSFLEDADWSARVRAAGWALRFAPDVGVTHLSEPVAGVRAGSARREAYWRFRNTGRFVRRHRPGSLPRVLVGFAGVGAIRAWQARDPALVWELLGALVEGYVHGAEAASEVGGSG